MLHEVIQSGWFWPTIVILLLVYYFWVFSTYFKTELIKIFSFNKSQKHKQTTKIQLSWEELAMGFAVHRRLVNDPKCDLDLEERSLLGKSPFKELIQQTTI